MDDVDLLDYACFTCGATLKLDRGTPDDRVSPGTPRMVYCPDCGTEHPHVLVALDAEDRVSARIRRELRTWVKDNGIWDPPDVGTEGGRRLLLEEEILAALDRIVPEEEGPVRDQSSSS